MTVRLLNGSFQLSFVPTGCKTPQTGRPPDRILRNLKGYINLCEIHSWNRLPLAGTFQLSRYFMKLKKVLLDLLTGPTLGVWRARPFSSRTILTVGTLRPCFLKMPAASVLCCFAWLSCGALLCELAFLYQGKENRGSKGCCFLSTLKIWHCLDFIFVVFKRGNKPSFPL